MSNEQQLPPLILVTAVGQPQPAAVFEFLQGEPAWSQLTATSPLVQLINEEQGHIAIDTIRYLKQDLSYASHQGKLRCYILLDAHKMTRPAQNAFLKSLEEPPAQTQIILVTPQPDQLLPTITSRCIVSYVTQPNRVEDEALPPLLRSLLLKPANVSYDAAITLAEELKDRDQAITTLQQAINWLYERSFKPNSNHNSSSLSHQLIKHYGSTLCQLLDTLEHLQQNVNTRLALEHCFFALKRIQ